MPTGFSVPTPDPPSSSSGGGTDTPEIPDNVVQSVQIRTILKLTQEEYDAIPIPDPTTLYVIGEGPA